MSEIERPEAGLPARVSDSDRDAVLDVLRAHCSAGALTLDEFSDRAGLALRARARDELDQLTVDLPELPARDARRPDVSTRRVFAICGTNRRRARWMLGRRLSAVAVAGASWIDLRHARFGHGGEEVTIRAFAFFGTVKVIVPKGIDVELTGISLFGAKTDWTDAGRAVPGAPVIKIKGLPIFGSVRVMSSTPQQYAFEQLRELGRPG